MEQLEEQVVMQGVQRLTWNTTPIKAMTHKVLMCWHAGTTLDVKNRFPGARGPHLLHVQCLDVGGW